MCTCRIFLGAPSGCPVSAPKLSFVEFQLAPAADDKVPTDFIVYPFDGEVNKEKSTASASRLLFACLDLNMLFFIDALYHE